MKKFLIGINWYLKLRTTFYINTYANHRLVERLTTYSKTAIIQGNTTTIGMALGSRPVGLRMIYRLWYKMISSRNQAARST